MLNLIHDEIMHQMGMRQKFQHSQTTCLETWTVCLETQPVLHMLFSGVYSDVCPISEMLHIMTYVSFELC